MMLLLALVALAPLQDAPPVADAKAALLDVLREPSPGQRRKKLRAALRGHRLDLDRWEAVLKQLPSPPLPLEDRAPGRIGAATTTLWTGRKTKLLETSVALYLPAKFDPKRRWPLLIACHGTGGDARGEVSQWVRIADRAGLVVLGATEQKENEGYRGSEHERLTQVSLLRWAKLRLPVDVDRVFLGGTSRGGHLTWDVATRYPDLWAGVIPLIGGPRLATGSGRNNLRLVRNLLDVAVRDLQGERDDPGLLFNLRHAFERLASARDAKLITFPGLGHSYDLGAVDWGKFFATKRRQAVPTRIRFWCVNKVESRRSWLRVTGLDKAVKDAYRPRVQASVWNKLDNDGRKRWVEKDAEKRTASIDARLEGDRAARTVVVTDAPGVRAIRILLPRSLWSGGAPKARLRVRWNGRTRKVAPRGRVETFLLDWCDRLDLETAPVAVVEVRR